MHACFRACAFSTCVNTDTKRSSNKIKINRISVLLTYPNYYTYCYYFGPCFAGGGSRLTVYGAENYSHNINLFVYRSDVGGSSIMASSNEVKTAMLIRLSKNQMYSTNYEGFNCYKQDKGLFAFDMMYMGLNRVVGSSHRPGEGLCSVCIYFLKESVQDLHGPKVISLVIRDILRSPAA